MITQYTIVIIFAVLVLTQFFQTPLTIKSSDSQNVLLMKCAVLIGVFAVSHILLRTVLHVQPLTESYNAPREKAYETVDEVEGPVERCLRETSQEPHKGTKKQLIAYPRGKCGPIRTVGYPYNLYVDWDKMY